jgi:hypothetical protein
MESHELRPGGFCSFLFRIRARHIQGTVPVSGVVMQLGLEIDFWRPDPQRPTLQCYKNTYRPLKFLRCG